MPLAPDITKASAAMVLVILDTSVLVFHGVGFRPPETFPSWEMIEHVNIFLCYVKYVQHDKE